MHGDLAIRLDRRLESAERVHKHPPTQERLPASPLACDAFPSPLSTPVPTAVTLMCRYSMSIIGGSKRFELNSKSKLQSKLPSWAIEAFTRAWLSAFRKAQEQKEQVKAPVHWPESFVFLRPCLLSG